MVRLQWKERVTEVEAGARGKRGRKSGIRNSQEKGKRSNDNSEIEREGT